MGIKLLTEAEHDLESLLAHIKALLEKDPAAHIVVNPKPEAAITVSGKVHPASATPTGHKDTK